MDGGQEGDEDEWGGCIGVRVEKEVGAKVRMGDPSAAARERSRESSEIAVDIYVVTVETGKSFAETEEVGNVWFHEVSAWMFAT